MNADQLANKIARSAPDCAKLTPFTFLDVDEKNGRVRVEFAPLPAFRNHFDAVQGGFAVAMLDAVISLAAYVGVREWLPTAEIKTSFLMPLPIGPCIGEGRILKAGRQLVFAEGRLMHSDRPAAIATATLARTMEMHRDG